MSTRINLQPTAHAPTHNPGGNDEINGLADDLGTSVFNGTAPTTWTDLDLSAVVGVSKNLVFLRIGYTGSLERIIAFRKNGDTSEYYDSGGRGGVERGFLYNGYCTIIVTTDASGIVEWKTSNAATTMTVDVMFHLRVG